MLSVSGEGFIQSSFEGSWERFGKYFSWRSSRKVAEVGSRSGWVGCGQWTDLLVDSMSGGLGERSWSVSMGLTGGGMMSRGFRGWAGGGSGMSSTISEFDVDTDRARGEGEIECWTALGSSPSSCGDVESGTANDTFRVCGEGRRLCLDVDLCGSSGISVSWDVSDESDDTLEADIL